MNDDEKKRALAESKVICQEMDEHLKEIEMSTTSPFADFDVRALLAQHRMIALVWCVDDVLEIRPDLSKEQAWEVLQQVDRHKDASVGISWDQLERWADELFPHEDEDDEEDDDEEG